MNIYDQINAMKKLQVLAVAEYANKRIEELDKEKREAFKRFVAAYDSREVIKLFGEDVYVNAWTTTYGPFANNEGTVFEFSNGSKIFINLD